MAITADLLYGVVAGVVLSYSIYPMQRIYTRLTNGNDVYDLEHWKLNVKLPPDTMWMNLGFWRTDGHAHLQPFYQACTNLLLEVLYTSRILERDGSSKNDKNSNNKKSIALLDLGIGCGEQTLELERLAQDGHIKDLSYVGLTLNPAQAKSASDKLAARMAEAENENETETDKKGRSQRFQLFCADASDPTSWDPAVRQAIEALGSSSGSHHDHDHDHDHDNDNYNGNNNDEDQRRERWLLALDCLVHFTPSRQPIFNLVGSSAGIFPANIMAFDLLLAEDATPAQRFAVRLVARLMGCPADTFLPQAAYRRQLVAAGYGEEAIVVRDVTEHVFPGLVAFLERREVALRRHGLSLGRLLIAKKVFEWFATSRVLRPSIIVARREGS